jgi:hypothetical protein
MKQQALKMIVGMLLVGTVISVADRNPVPMFVMAAVSYAIWQVAKGFGG